MRSPGFSLAFMIKFGYNARCHLLNVSEWFYSSHRLQNSPAKNWNSQWLSLRKWPLHTWGPRTCFSQLIGNEAPSLPSRNRSRAIHENDNIVNLSWSGYLEQSPKSSTTWRMLSFSFYEIFFEPLCSVGGTRKFESWKRTIQMNPWCYLQLIKNFLVDDSSAQDQWVQNWFHFHFPESLFVRMCVIIEKIEILKSLMQGRTFT